MIKNGIPKENWHGRGPYIMGELTKYLVKEHILCNVEAADWREAIQKAAQPLVDAGKIGRTYVEHGGWMWPTPPHGTIKWSCAYAFLVGQPR